MLVVDDRRYDLPESLNESPSEKEGKWASDLRPPSS